MLDVNRSSGCTIFFGSYDHLTAPGGWGANSNRCYYHLFNILVKCCFDLGFSVERDGYRCVSCMRYCSFFEVDMSWFCWHYCKRGWTIKCCVMKLIKKVFFKFGDIFRSSQCGSVNGCWGNCGCIVDVVGVVVSAGSLIWVVVVAVAATDAGEVWVEMVICVYPGILFYWNNNDLLSRKNILVGL